MAEAAPDDFALPPLREDLRIERAAPRLDGGPAWVIYDPARHRYFQIGRRAIELLSLWSSGTANVLISRYQTERGAEVGAAELKSLIRFLFANQLTLSPEGGRSAAYARQSERPGALSTLAQRYLFFRIPLWRPDGFLRATLPLALVFFSRAFLWLTVLSGIIGVYFASRQWDAFADYAESFISPSGAIAYFIVLALVKSLHELGHAYQATMRGVRVSTMGVAFMVMFPLLYTDVSDAWRLRDRRDKLMIDAGGVLVELSLAAFATCAWAFLPDGAMRQAAFAVATSTWFLSLFINLNPFMRFDGYYFLADAVGVQNLQPRAFAVARWRLREALFGLGRPPPEPLSTGMRRFMAIYGMATWVYRLFLFIGIALIVYAFFFKALGMLLFVVEIVFLVLVPIGKELKVWFDMRSEILLKPRTYVSMGALGVFVALLFLPLSSRVEAPGVLLHASRAAVFPADGGRIVEVMVAEGDMVFEGQPLVRLASPEMDAEEAMARSRLALAVARRDRRAGSAADRSETLTLERLVEAETDRIAAIAEEKERLLLRAPVSGHAVELAPGLVAGRWIGRTDQVAYIVGDGPGEVIGYVAEIDRARIEVGAPATFTPDDPSLPVREARVETIDGFATTVLELPYLSATNGGTIPVKPAKSEGSETAVDGWFGIAASAEDVPERTAIRGVLRIEGEARSIAGKIGEQVSRVLIRETGW